MDVFLHSLSRLTSLEVVSWTKKTILPAFQHLSSLSELQVQPCTCSTCAQVPSSWKCYLLLGSMTNAPRE